jgi:uncharacterized protein (TIGR02271 family)
MMIFFEDGRKGSVTRRIKSEGRPDQLVIEFEDGTRLMMSEDQVTLRKDGNATLSRRSANLSIIPIQAVELAPGEQLVVPVATEELRVQTRRVVRGVVHVQTRVETSEETVDEPLLHEEVTIERTPIDQEIRGEVPKAREHNGTLVIPIVEEVLVVSKQLRLKEEIRVIRRQTTVRTPQKFQVRRQVVEVERVEDGTVLAEPSQHPEQIGTQTGPGAARNTVGVSTNPQSSTAKKPSATAQNPPPAAKKAATKKESPRPAPKKRGR